MKNLKNTKTMCICVYWCDVYLWLANETFFHVYVPFVAEMSIFIMWFIL